MVDQYDIRQSECSWNLKDYPEKVFEAQYDRGYCIDAPDYLPFGGVRKTFTGTLYTFTHSRSIGLALSSIR